MDIPHLDVTGANTASTYRNASIAAGIGSSKLVARRDFRRESSASSQNRNDLESRPRCPRFDGREGSAIAVGVRRIRVKPKMRCELSRSFALPIFDRPYRFRNSTSRSSARSATTFPGKQAFLSRNTWLDIISANCSHFSPLIACNGQF